jgi:hypothetical protein
MPDFGAAEGLLRLKRLLNATDVANWSALKM